MFWCTAQVWLLELRWPTMKAGPLIGVKPGGAISFAGFAVTPIYEICAFLFGIGIGLTIDEFALWLYLDDVYWKEQGRASVDAAVIISALIGLIMLGVRPFEVSDNDASALIGSLIAAIVALATCFVCLLKGRVYHAIFGAFLWPLALYGALRLAKPDSSWARRRYDERDPEKRARAASRFPPDRRTERFKERLRDAIGGTTESEYLSKLKRRG